MKIFALVPLLIILSGCVKHIEVPVPYKVEIMVPVPCPRAEPPTRPILDPVPAEPREDVLRTVVSNMKKVSDYALQLEVIVAAGR